MIKVPGTKAGLPAIRQLLGEGINVNITLLFAQSVYEQVADAYVAGTEHFAAAGGDVRRLASVASFFVSRIDTEIDRRIDERLAAVQGALANALGGIKGKVAIANAKMAYQRYKRIFSGARWEALHAKGARPQRLLWASTGTKNKAYSDVLYVEIADRSRYRQHGAAGDDGRLPRSRQAARQPRRELHRGRARAGDA